MKIDSREAPKIGAKIGDGCITSSTTALGNAINGAAFMSDGAIDVPSGHRNLNVLVLPEKTGRPRSA